MMAGFNSAIVPSALLMGWMTALCVCSFRRGVLSHRVTLSGILCGMVVVTLLPGYSGHATPLAAFGFSVAGLLTGFFGVWILLEAGKALFGTVTLKYAPAVGFSVHPDGSGVPVLQVGGDFFSWENTFVRVSDRVTVEGKDFLIQSLAGVPQSFEAGKLVLGVDEACIGETSIPLESVGSISGKAFVLRMPREVIGFGVTMMTAMAGSFLGWKGVLLVVAGTSALLATVGLLFAFETWNSQGARLQVAPCMWLACAGYLALNLAGIV